jgi:hypothetical protein
MTNVRFAAVSAAIGLTPRDSETPFENKPPVAMAAGYRSSLQDGGAQKEKRKSRKKKTRLGEGADLPEQSETSSLQSSEQVLCEESDVASLGAPPTFTSNGTANTPIWHDFFASKSQGTLAQPSSIAAGKVSRSVHGSATTPGVGLVPQSQANPRVSRQTRKRAAAEIDTGILPPAASAQSIAIFAVDASAGNRESGVNAEHTHKSARVKKQAGMLRDLSSTLTDEAQNISRAKSFSPECGKDAQQRHHVETNQNKPVGVVGTDGSMAATLDKAADFHLRPEGGLDEFELLRDHEPAPQSPSRSHPPTPPENTAEDQSEPVVEEGLAAMTTIGMSTAIQPVTSAQWRRTLLKSMTAMDELGELVMQQTSYRETRIPELEQLLRDRDEAIQGLMNTNDNLEDKLATVTGQLKKERGKMNELGERNKRLNEAKGQVQTIDNRASEECREQPLVNRGQGATETSKDEVRVMMSHPPKNKKDADKNPDGLLMVFDIEQGGESLVRFSFPRAQMAPYSRYFASKAFEMEEATPKNMHTIQLPCSSWALIVALRWMREKTFPNHTSKVDLRMPKESLKELLEAAVLLGMEDFSLELIKQV